MSVRFIILSCIAGIAYSQVDSRDAAILKDMRYLSGDGTFGAAYSQEDGVEFKEESDEYGNRRGSYSYVDPTGQRRTVHYTAGVNGFHASGDHLPPQPAPTPPKPAYEPLPQYNSPDYQSPRARALPPARPSRPPKYQLVRRPYEPAYETQEPQYEPAAVAPVIPSHQPRFREQPIRVAPVRTSTPRYNRPPPPQHDLLQYQTTSYDYPVHYESKYDNGPSHPIGPLSRQYGPHVRPTIATPPAPLPTNPFLYNEITTPSPRRFYPPGKLDFNRTPDGYSYTFSKS